MFLKPKKLPYEIIAKLMSILEDYYSNFGELLVFIGSSRIGCSTQQSHARKVLFNEMLRKHGALGFFANGVDEESFKKGYERTYQVFNAIARIVGIICSDLASKDAKVTDATLVYTLLAFEEISNVTKLTDFSHQKYAAFSDRAAKKIYGIIGEPMPNKHSIVFDRLYKENKAFKKAYSDTEQFFLDKKLDLQQFQTEYSVKI